MRWKKEDWSGAVLLYVRSHRADWCTPLLLAACLIGTENGHAPKDERLECRKMIPVRGSTHGRYGRVDYAFLSLYSRREIDRPGCQLLPHCPRLILPGFSGHWSPMKSAAQRPRLDYESPADPQYSIAAAVRPPLNYKFTSERPQRAAANSVHHYYRLTHQSINSRTL